jgi:hypothetical protein
MCVDALPEDYGVGHLIGAAPATGQGPQTLDEPGGGSGANCSFWLTEAARATCLRDIVEAAYGDVVGATTRRSG